MSETNQEEKVKESIAVGKMEDGTVLELDMSKILENVDTTVQERMKKYMEEVKEYYQKDKDSANGKGLVEERLGPKASKLIEQFRNVSQADITEQWSVVIPNYTTKELAGHLRDYVWITDATKGHPGDTVYIPYVKDFDLTTSTTVGDDCAAVTSIISETSTTLKEGSAYTDVGYHIIEKYDQNLLDEVNKAFVRAAVRCEDYNLMAALHAASSNTQFAGKMDRDTYATAAFVASWLPDAIGYLLAAGKDVKPGDCVLWMHAKAYTALIKELVAANAFTVARPDVVQNGLLTDYLGVRLVIGGLMPCKARQGTGTGTCYPAYLMRAKRCLALAPKRELLIETDRLIKEKDLRIAASHTFGVKVLDFKEAVQILCNTRL